jgi:polysaccharide pyruvyl transferase WcaK-like protein/SAM-dependent methyltransferase
VRILVEPCAHGMINAGDTAMLSVATARLRQMWPDAQIGVITDVPARLALHCPGTLPVPAEGRRIWLEEPHVGARVHGMLSPSGARGLRAVEERVRRRMPSVASSTIRLRRRLRRLRNDDLTEFLGWLYSADLVVATGAGLLADPYVPRACSVLELLETAIRRGVPTAMLGQGIGPLTDERMRAVAGRVLPKVELIGLREEHYGRPELRALGVEDRRMVTTGDDAIELALKRASNSRDGGGIGVGIRVARYSGATEEAIAAVGSALRKAAIRHGAELIPVPISAAVKERDAMMIARVMGIDEGTIPPLDTPAAVIDQVGRCRVVVSGSYHGAVFALAQGVPAIGLAGSEYYFLKFRGLAKQFEGGCEMVRLDQPQLEGALEAAVDDAWRSKPGLGPKLLQSAERQVAHGWDAYRELHRIVTTPEVKPTDRAHVRGALARVVGIAMERVARLSPVHARRTRFNLHLQAEWQGRAEQAVELWMENAARPASGPSISVGDLGCGNGRVRDLLATRLGRAFTYQGYDLQPQSRAVVKLDLSRELPDREFDLVFALGLLEYLPDPADFLARLRRISRFAIFSYAFLDSAEPLGEPERAARGWRTHYTREQLERLSERAGWIAEDSVVVDRGRTVVGLWRSGRR